MQDAVSMMVANKIGVLLVTQGGSPASCYILSFSIEISDVFCYDCIDSLGVVGIITERDLLKKTSPRSYFQKKALIKDVMSSHVMCIPTSMTIIE